MEAVTAAHCGHSLAGSFGWSLTMTDILTTWTKSRAGWDKGAEGVSAQIQDIEAHQPSALQRFDCENSFELLNCHLARYFTGQPSLTSFTRSRPCQRNDNAHAEQKNQSHVRQLFGCDRLAEPQLLRLMNDLYTHKRSLNPFIPKQAVEKLLQTIFGLGKVTSSVRQRILSSTRCGYLFH